VKLGPKLALALLVVGIVPTALMGALASSANSDELERTAREQQARRATDLAAAVRGDLDRAAEALQLSAGFLPVDQLSRAELEEALALPLHQVRGVEVLMALDAQGTALTGPVHRLPAGLDAAELRRFADAIPWRQALATGTAVGPPFVRAGVAHVAIAVRVGSAVVIAADVALLDATARLGALAQEGQEAMLTDAMGASLMRAGPALTKNLPTVLGSCPPGCSSRATPFLEGEPVLAAVARVPDFDWAVLITQRLEGVLAPAARVRRYTLYWTLAGVVLALALASVLVRDILRPVRKLSESARQLSAGRFEVELTTGSGDELDELAVAFAHMVGEVKRRDGEIRAWNADLEARVEAGTRKLREAQDQVARARRLTALGSLSAGFAHELNNPLTAVLGLSTLMHRDARTDDERENLEEVVAQSRRMMDILSRLISLAEGERGGALRVPLGDLVASALTRHASSAAACGVKTLFEAPVGGLDCSGDPVQLQAMIDALLENALQAMPAGGLLKVSLSASEGEALRLEVRDTGRGMSPAVQERIFDPFFTTKPSGTEVGLGLTVSHRIVENHHGSISVHSEEGRGSTFTVILPAAAEEAHLQ
jgi:signal transduction histidine kinase